MVPSAEAGMRAIMEDAEARQSITEALQLWQGGNQGGAIDRIRPTADAGEPAALGLIAWFLHQMGEPRWREGMPYAEQALKKGMPWVAGYFVGNMMNDPNLRPQVPDFMRWALSAGWSLDPIAHAPQAMAQNDP